MQINPLGKLSYIPRGPPKAHNSDDVVVRNQERESVSDTIDTSEENSKTLTTSVRTTR